MTIGTFVKAEFERHDSTASIEQMEQGHKIANAITAVQAVLLFTFSIVWPIIHAWRTRRIIRRLTSTLTAVLGDTPKSATARLKEFLDDRKGYNMFLRLCQNRIATENLLFYKAVRNLNALVEKLNATTASGGTVKELEAAPLGPSCLNICVQQIYHSFVAIASEYLGKRTLLRKQMDHFNGINDAAKWISSPNTTGRIEYKEIFMAPQKEVLNVSSNLLFVAHC